jgi:molecular chaperone GrpE
MADERTTTDVAAPTDEPVAESTDQPQAPPLTAAAPVADAPEEPAAVDLEELRARAAERDEYLALAQRTRADLENYRKRVVRDAAAAESRAVARLVRELLPALDNLERALAAAATDGQGGHLLEGMRLVRDDLGGALARAGVESFTSQGERFDPELHEAIAQHEVAGAVPGTVVEVYQAGYRMNGTLIRPARVVVAARPAAPAAAPTPDDRGS